MIKVYQALNVCDVCRLLEGDVTPKVCGYCKLCDSNICQADMNNWWRRGKAALKRRLEPNFKGDKNYQVNP
jgi:hypothetical protein